MSDFEREVLGRIPKLSHLEERAQEERLREQQEERLRRMVSEIGHEAVRLLTQHNVETLPILQHVKGTSRPNLQYTPLGSGWHVYDEVEHTDDGDRRTSVGVDVDGKILSFSGSRSMAGPRRIISPDYVEGWGSSYALKLVEHDDFKTGLAYLIRFNRPYEP